MACQYHATLHSLLLFHAPLYILEYTSFKFVVAIQLICSFFQRPSVKMEIFGWLEVTYQVEWKFAIVTYGELCVMMVGMSRMLEWCADNLDYPHHVSITTT